MNVLVIILVILTPLICWRASVLVNDFFPTGRTPSITFNQFKAFYEVIPDRFYLHSDYVCVNTSTDCDFCLNKYYFKTNGDLRKYQRFLDKKEEIEMSSKKRNEDLEAKNALLEVVKLEIDRRYNMAKNEVESARLEQERILENLVKDYNENGIDLTTGIEDEIPKNKKGKKKHDNKE